MTTDIVQRLRDTIVNETPARYPDVIRAAIEEIERLRAALAPFSWYYSVNDCAKTDQKYMEVPVEDLQRAFGVHPVTDECLAPSLKRL